MPHQSSFALRTHGGVCAGERWIYDGDEAIAQLTDATVEQPEQNLRYFDAILKPVELRNLKLRPGGRPLLAGVQLYWKLGPIATTQLQSVEVAGQDSSRLTLAVVTTDPGGVATSRREVEISYDPALESYLYDFRAHLEIHSPEVFDNPCDFGVNEHIRFEYSDPWYCDIPGPATPFPGMWQKRFSHLVAEPADGTIWQMPLNHLATGIPSPQSFAAGGLFVLGYDPGNNPAFEFFGDTARRTSASVCNWGYDIHLAARYTRDELYQPICPHFRIRLCPDEKVQAMLQAAAPIPSIEFAGFAELPLYQRSTSFAHSLKLNEPTSGPTDPWPWLPYGEGAEWSRDEGRTDNYALKISKDTPGPSEWIMDREGDGAWLERWDQGTGYRVSCHIKTENVEGRGSFLALRWHIYNHPDRYPYRCSQKFVGTHDWTRVEVEIPGPPPPDSSSICIVLRQDGSGTTLFDDLEVVQISGLSQNAIAPQG
ncbi:MAG: hypothetical protein VX293_02180 [Candidatus Latescibacterota bacterium]|nr:hypothetical protein [Candidatus Latescibacterota bacterium]